MGTSLFFDMRSCGPVIYPRFSVQSSLHYLPKFHSARFRKTAQTSTSSVLLLPLSTPSSTTYLPSSPESSPNRRFMYSSLVKPLYRGGVGACGRFFRFLCRGVVSIEVLSRRFSGSFLGAWVVSSGSMGGEVARYALVYGEM